ncbi:MAG: hypothetical protein ABIF87_12480 [Pseudomonadota bacterium]
MPTNWKDINEDAILDFTDANTGLMAQYQRIMERRSRDAMESLKDQVSHLTETLQKESNALQEKTQQLIKSYETISEAQGKQKKVTIALSIVIAIATLVYTGFTCWSVTVMKDSNQIQSQSSLIMQNSNDIQSQSVSAMREANEIQKIFLELKTRPYLSIEPVKDDKTGFYFKANLAADILEIEVQFTVFNMGDTPATKILPPNFQPLGGLTLAQDASVDPGPAISLGPRDKQNHPLHFKFGGKSGNNKAVKDFLRDLTSGETAIEISYSQTYSSILPDSKSYKTQIKYRLFRDKAVLLEKQFE